jgi:hypothetical protein
MQIITSSLRNERGSALIIAMMILILLTVIGLAATLTTTSEYSSVSQEARYKEGFMVSDSGQMREGQEIGNGGYTLTQSGPQLNPLDEDVALRDRTPTTGDPMRVGDVAYDPTVTFRQAGIPRAKGTSSAFFSQYEYGVAVDARVAAQTTRVDPDQRNVSVDTVYAKFGPKAGS